MQFHVYLKLALSGSCCWNGGSVKSSSCSVVLALAHVKQWHVESYQEIYLAENESIFIFLADFQMDRFPGLTHHVAAQPVVLTHRGMREWQRGGAGQCHPIGGPNFCKNQSVIELHLKLMLSLQPDDSTTSLYLKTVFFEFMFPLIYSLC